MDALLDQFQPGRTIYLPGASGEILGLAERLAAEPDRMAGVHIVSCLLPGFNRFDYAGLHPTARLTTFLLPPELHASFRAGRVRVMPLPYSGIAAYVRDRLDIDVAIAHVAPPGANGEASLGIAADFTKLAVDNAKASFGVINPRMPSIKRGPALKFRDMIELESPLVTTDPPRGDTVLDKIAIYVADLIPNSSALQIGIGGAPAAVWSKLCGHRELRLASGLLAQDCRPLLETEVFLPRPVHHTGVALGDEDFYSFLGGQDLVGFAGADETHHIPSLAGIERLHAVNSALEVDLFGQVNLEWRGDRLASGVGGAPDFTRGALLSPGGRSIIALPSTARQDSISRIVVSLAAATVSLGRDVADLVVTEYGVADLRDRSVDERAQALIAIAAPQFRDDLAAGWRALARKF